jgi:hypothetical protein
MLSGDALCKGEWSLGTSCGKCSRCLESAPAEIKRLRGLLRTERQVFEMYRDAWIRELGGKLLPKGHLIDALVMTTRKLREDLFAYKEAERVASADAALAARDECEASWRAAAEASPQ